MAKYGLLIDYNYCTGCHGCEVACQQEHGYPEGKTGMKVAEFEYETFKGLAIDFLPYPTDLCDLCVSRQKNGERPACVKHCQSRCMEFGLLGELVKTMEKGHKMVIFAP
jgi:anaerobic dimethyl sulfoxide reductase subunit B (iron-sulfur subunit)